MAKGAYIGAPSFAKRNLPSGYTQVRYIESAGTQYFSTGFAPNNNSRIVLDIQMTSTATQHIFGARATSTSGLFFAAVTSATAIRVDYGSEQKSNTVASVLDRVKIDLNKNTCMVGGASSTYTASTFAPNVPMLLFGSNTDGTIVSDTYKAHMKLYSCKIYDNGVLVRDYVPCTNASNVAGLYDLVNGTFAGSETSTAFSAGDAIKVAAHKVKKGYIGVPTTMASVSDLEIGSIVKLNVNGKATEFLVAHQGNPDATLYDASCDGTWLMMKDCYEQKAWSSSSSTYAKSDINNYLNNDFFNLFDSGVRSLIKEVKIPCSTTGSGSDVSSGSNGVPVKVFLLSGYEVGFVSMSYLPKDGAKLDYFIEGTGTDAKNRRMAQLGSPYVEWWLRTHYTYAGVDVYVVTTAGGADWWSAPNSKGIRPTIIVPSNAGVDSNGFITGVMAGTSNVAHKIKKAYIGVNGVAKLCWAGDNPVYTEEMLVYKETNTLNFTDLPFEPKYFALETLGTIPSSSTIYVASIYADKESGLMRIVYKASSQSGFLQYKEIYDGLSDFKVEWGKNAFYAYLVSYKFYSHSTSGVPYRVTIWG